MRIAVIGTGRMGQGFAQALARTHEVVLGSREPKRAGRLASRLGVGVATACDAARGADVVVLAVPWPAVDDVLEALGDLDGMVLVDITHPHNDEQRAALKGHSTAEAIARHRPRARLVKGWNHLFAPHLTSPVVVDGVAASVLIAGTTWRPRRSRPGSRGTWASTPSTSGRSGGRGTWSDSSGR